MNKLRKIAASIGITFVVFSSVLIDTPATADTTAGLIQDVYTYDSSALPDRVDTYKLCNTSTVANMNFDVGGGTVANCQEDFVLIHWHGYITLPITGDVTFNSWADDGFFMTIGDQTVIDNWWLKGCGGGGGTAKFEAGISQKIDVWWYEYGGGACNYLFYDDPTTGNTLVPDSAFTVEAQAVAPVVPPVTPVDPPVVVPPVDPQPPVVPPVDPNPPVVPPVTPPTTDQGSGSDVTPKQPQDTPQKTPAVVAEVKTPATVVPAPVAEPTSKPYEPPVTQVDPATIDPQSLTPQEVTQLAAVANTVLATADENSEEYQNALDQLMIVAQADDIVVDPELAATPVIGAVAVGITNAINALGNIGADMSPAHRATAKKEVVAAVIVTQVATTAAGIATQAAASAAGAAGSVSSRRKN